MIVSSGVVENGRSRYEGDIARRRRRLTWEVGLRSFTMQATWLVVLAAGAAVPLAAALGWPEWVAPVLGFAIVVATGIEKIFGRTTDAAVAVDALRRRLDRERRKRDARSGSDEADADGFDAYVRGCERAIAEFDDSMLAYTKKATGRDDDE
ncbi:hypothetical protein P0L94_11945 [Microbacter sp. GSS18]|nr:hypothetical protein P0L94_11945 [Microbacter sp. GSS18]